LGLDLRTCGATPGGPDLTGVNLSEQTIIQGVVIRGGISDGVPNGKIVDNAYVQLLDSTREFTAEVPTDSEGRFRFFASPGPWHLVVMAHGGREELIVQAQKGLSDDLVIHI
jgi:hypothetical protein